MVQALDGGGVGAFIESGFFDSSADEEATVAARDQVDLGRADYVFDERVRGHQQAQHLAFNRACGEGMWKKLSRPGSGAVDDFGGVKRCFRGGDADGSALGNGDGGDFVSGREIHAAMLRGLPCGLGEGAGIDAALFEVQSWTIRVGKNRLDFLQKTGKPMAGNELGIALGVLQR